MFWRVLNGIAIIISAFWLIADRGWDSALAFVLAVGALQVQDRRSSRKAVVYDHMYDTTESRRFYNTIAPEYDARNSDLLLATHRQVIDRIRSHVDGRDSWSALDLCGGTGKQIALQFADDGRGRWMYVDASEQMERQFEHNLWGSELETAPRVADVYEFLADLRGAAKHDVVVVALALSSLPRNPDWSKVAKLLKSDGILIVAEIEPSYAAIHRHFSVCVNSETHALLTRKIHLADLISDVSAAGLATADATSVREGGKTYSYLQVFRRSS